MIPDPFHHGTVNAADNIRIRPDEANINEI
jgi:hypothetical protein